MLFLESCFHIALYVEMMSVYLKCVFQSYIVLWEVYRWNHETLTRCKIIPMGNGYDQQLRVTPSIS